MAPGKRRRGPRRCSDTREVHSSAKEVEAMRPYERPTLTLAGSFKKLTGLGGTGPKDAVTKKQCL